jgi:hypothetical protein
MGIPLIYDITELEAFRKQVEQRKLPIDEMYAIAEGRSPIVGDRPDHAMNLDVGWRIVYSVEEHPHENKVDRVWLRHMSMSQAMPGRGPNQIALGEITKALGFPPLSQCQIQPDSGSSAIAVLAVFDGDAT